MLTQSFVAHSIEETNYKLQKIIETDFKPTVAITFVSIRHNLSHLTKIFTNHNIDLVGCTSSGEITDNNIYEGNISVLLLDMPQNDYKILKKHVNDDDNYTNITTLGKQINHSFYHASVLLFSGGITFDGVKIVDCIKEVNKSDLPIYGGLAGDDLRLKTTFSFSNNWISESGVVALVINNDKIKVKGKCVSGWESIGGKHQVTKCKGNILYEINEKPALDTYNKYFGFANDLNNQEFIQSISGQYPLIFHKPGGYTIMRSAVINDLEKNAIVLAGSVSEGDYFEFGIAPDFELYDRTITAFKPLKREIPNIDAALIINCKGRQTAFGPEIENETEAIYSLWKAPTVGFFSYGEIGNVDNGPCEFHNVTCTLATLTAVN